MSLMPFIISKFRPLMCGVWVRFVFAWDSSPPVDTLLCFSAKRTIKFQLWNQSPSVNWSVLTNSVRPPWVLTHMISANGWNISRCCSTSARAHCCCRASGVKRTCELIEVNKKSHIRPCAGAEETFWVWWCFIGLIFLINCMEKAAESSNFSNWMHSAILTQMTAVIGQFMHPPPVTTTRILPGFTYMYFTCFGYSATNWHWDNAARTWETNQIGAE